MVFTRRSNSAGSNNKTKKNISSLKKTSNSRCVFSWTTDSNDLADENLDFEPDLDEINPPRVDVTNEPSKFSEISVGHKKHLLPVPQSFAVDQRHLQYLPKVYPTDPSTLSLLDSSSDSLSQTSTVPDSEKIVNVERAMRGIEDEITSPEKENPLLQSREHVIDTWEEFQKTESLDSPSCHADNELDTNLPESSLEIDKMNQAKEVCLMGNARILLPRLKRSDLKRSNSDSESFVSKRKKWDVRYKPDGSVIQLYLKDLGYVSESSAQSKSLENKNFKVPTLPPLKRPPTRLKPPAKENNLKVNVSPGKRTVEINNVTNVPEMDDYISLTASSLPSNKTLDVSTDEVKNLSVPDQFERNERVTNWVVSQQPDFKLIESYQTPKLSPGLTPLNYGPSTSPFGVPSAANAVMAQPNGSTPFKFSQIHPLFTGYICYFHYFNGHCRRAACSKMHMIPDQFLSRFQKSDPQTLVQAYRFSLDFERLYTDVYPLFIAAFEKNKMQNETIAMLKDLFAVKTLKKTDCVERVVEVLERFDLSFSEAIELILLSYGVYHYPELADILMGLMSQRMPFSEHWPVFKKILLAHGRVAPDLAGAILYKVTTEKYPLNKAVCLDIFKTVVTEQRTDVTCISNEYLVCFKSLLGNTLEAAWAMDTGPLSHSSSLSSQLEEAQQANDEEPTKDVDDRRRVSHFRLTDNQAKKKRPIDRDYRKETGSQHSSRSSGSFGYRTMENADALTKGSPPNSQAVEVNLAPDARILGQCDYRPDYSFQRSLHNLLPDASEHVDIDEADVRALDKVTKVLDGAKFLKLLHKYKGKSTIENFITMTVAHLKTHKRRLESLLMLFRECTMVQRNCSKDKHVKAVFEVVFFNLLLDYQQQSYAINDGKRLLLLFSDWDSIVSSKSFRHRVSHMGRYIFLAKVMASNKCFEDVLDIFQNPRLNLLKSCDRWPYKHNKVVDLENRNNVLNSLFKNSCETPSGLRNICNLYRHAFTDRPIHGYEVEKQFNVMLIKMIDAKHTAALRIVLEDIDVFFRKMEKNVLRGCAIVMRKELDDQANFYLYGKCCKRGIYAIYSGYERDLLFTNIMLDEELELILRHFFSKLSKNPYAPSKDLTLRIGLSKETIGEGRCPQTIATVKMVRSVSSVRMALIAILKRHFSIETNEAVPVPTVVIANKTLRRWWVENKK